jgi:hypothetical protein
MQATHEDYHKHNGEVNWERNALSAGWRSLQRREQWSSDLQLKYWSKIWVCLAPGIIS